MSREIGLKNRSGAVVAAAIVDDEDYETLSQYSWSLNGGYAVRAFRRSEAPYKGNQSMHRQILGLTPDNALVGDHINWDKLDNRRVNLRAITKRQNMRHRPGHISLSRRARPSKASRKWGKHDPRFSRLSERPSDVRVYRPGDPDYPV